MDWSFLGERAFFPANNISFMVESFSIYVIINSEQHIVSFLIVSLEW